MTDDTSTAAPLALDGLDSIDFGELGLIPAVVQDLRTREVLMVGFTNREMLAKTLETGNAWFWSRSRQQPWQKGETSGNFLRVREVRRNCEDNSLLYLAIPVGPTCHTGARTCFYRRLDGTPVGEPSGFREGSLDWDFEIIRQRQREMPEGSYVAGLLRQGVDRIAKKVGEEAAEVIIAAKNRSREELAWEMADLWFHSLIALADAGMEPADVYRVEAARHAPKSVEKK
jgi:phosphoribosyl-ATP pyrophosphohydrolase/phosphoribosyl-AMP cyclohydrolase